VFIPKTVDLCPKPACNLSPEIPEEVDRVQVQAFTTLVNLRYDF
jgi:hypothetical protein